MPHARRRAFTLVELLVVISLIGMLLSLLLPAVQAAREAARQCICKAHLKEIATALLNHESAKRHFPSGGWGFGWIGDPDRGTGRNQPGGWAFSTLPYIERRDLAELGGGRTFSEKKKYLTVVAQTPLPLFNCPTRRTAELSAFDVSAPPINFNLVDRVAQSDYAMNAGDFAPKGGVGPKTLGAGDSLSYPWPDTAQANGISYLRSFVVRAEITDGSSHTYMVGEKYISASAVLDPGDDQSMYSGYDYDTLRWGKPGAPPLFDGTAIRPDRFGSSHPAGCEIGFCDGSVRTVSYRIDPEVHRRLANRRDGLPIDDASIGD